MRKELLTLEFKHNVYTFSVDYYKIVFQLDEPIQDDEPEFDVTYDIKKITKFDGNGDEYKPTELDLEKIEKEVERDCYK